MATFCEEVADALLRRAVVLLNNPGSNREVELLTLGLICLAERLREPWTDENAYGDGTEIQDTDNEDIAPDEYGDHPKENKGLENIHNSNWDFNNNNIENVNYKSEDANNNIGNFGNNTEIQHQTKISAGRKIRNRLQKIFHSGNIRGIDSSERRQRPRRSIWSRIRRLLTRPQRDAGHKRPRHERCRSPIDPDHKRSKSPKDHDGSRSPKDLDHKRFRSPEDPDHERSRSQDPDHDRPRSPEEADPDRFRSSKDAGHENDKSSKDLDQESCRSPKDPDHKRSRSPNDTDQERCRSSKETDHKRSRSPNDPDQERCRSSKDPDLERSRSPKWTTCSWGMISIGRLGRRRTRPALRASNQDKDHEINQIKKKDQYHEDNKVGPRLSGGDFN